MRDTHIASADARRRGATMADRKQFENVPEPDAELMDLLSSSRNEPASDDELREQRISFAFGNAMNSAGVTKESVRHASEHIRLLA
jgi:hypothetical protein